MNIFLDTSSLFKLYHRETDTERIERFFTDHTIKTVFLSEIAKIEFASTIWKKVRAQQINETQARTILASFESDFNRYTFFQTDNIVIENARHLIEKYGRQGLRTLDSIQLSSAVLLKYQADVFLTTDKLLDIFFKKRTATNHSLNNSS